MAIGTFSQRYGYQSEPQSFEAPGHLPDIVRELAGRLMVEHFNGLSNWIWRFTEAVEAVLPTTPTLYDWARSVPEMGEKHSSAFAVYTVDENHQDTHLIQPLMDCDWWLFYDIVEKVCVEWERTGSTRGQRFTPKFNKLLESYRIPWILQSGWITPVADAEFSEELEYARQVKHAWDDENLNDPHLMIREALDALRRREGRPDPLSACGNAWSAWKAVASRASGVPLSSRKRNPFDWVEAHHPELHATMSSWKKRAQTGRHPETGDPLSDETTRFIVMLCANAVRFLCPHCNDD